MKRVLILLTSSYPFGTEETFVAGEIPYLAAAFDHLVIVSNNTGDDLGYPVPPNAKLVRIPYELSFWEKTVALRTLLYRAPREELLWIARRYRLPITRLRLATVVVSWAKALKFSRVIRSLGSCFPDARVYGYSYWANDMAVAAAIARERGWIHRAFCRAHRWDVYFERTAAGFLPFRRYLAARLDHYRFVSDHGRRYFDQVTGCGGFPSVGRSYLGVPAVSPAPVSVQHPFVLASCSALIPRKRVELIAEALELVVRPLTWIHLGDGPNRATLERVCSRLPRSIVAERRGWIENAAVVDVLKTRGVSVFINTGASEGVPVSIMEAMAAGIPVIATDVGGVSEIIEHQKNGILLSADPSPRAVANAIEAFATMAAREYSSYSMQAWYRWRETFDADKNYREFLRDVCECGPLPGIRSDARGPLGVEGQRA